MKQEIEETSEEIVADSHADLDSQQIAGTVTEPGLFMQYPSKDVRVARTSHSQNQQTPLHFEDSAFNKSSSSVDSAGIWVQDDLLLPELEISSHQGDTDKTVYSSTSKESYSDCIVQDSQESNGMDDDIESTCSPVYFHRSSSSLLSHSHKKADLISRVDHLGVGKHTTFQKSCTSDRCH